MDILNALVQAGGAEALSRELGVDQSTAQAGMGALLPAILGGMQNQAAAHPEGEGGLASILGGLGGGGLLANVLGAEPTNVEQGNDVLGQIFGSKDTSRAVANHASEQTGIAPDLLKKMLPIVAMMAVGYFMNQRGQGGAGGGIGGGLLGGLAGSVLSSMLGGGSAQANPLNSILEGLTNR